MKYQVLSARHPDTLVGLVQGLIDCGWRPCGGVAFQQGAGWATYLQAMTKEEYET